jgi:hypothetical protein
MTLRPKAVISQQVTYYAMASDDVKRAIAATA